MTDPNQPEELKEEDLKPAALLKRIKAQEKKIEDLKKEKMGEKTKPKGKDKRKNIPKRGSDGRWIPGTGAEESPKPEALESGRSDARRTDDEDKRNWWRRFWEGDGD